MMRRFLVAYFVIATVSCSYSFSLFFTFTSIQVFAQTTDNQITLPGTPDLRSITLSASSDHPKPGQSVTLTVNSFSINLSNASITWFINGRQAQSGTGLTSYTATVGNTGSVTTVSVSVTDSSGSTFSQSMRLSPASVDILWQARTYTPVFYEGKALYSNESDITLVAIPNFSTKGVIAGSHNYIYTWRQDGTVLGDSSGYGKDSITLSGTIIVKPINMSVTVSTSDGTVSGSNSITLFPQAPQVMFYQESPLYGTLMNQALSSTYSLHNSEIVVQAVPYFFSTNSPHDVSPLSFSWQVNNNQTVTKTTDDLTLRQPGNVSGNSNIGVTVTNQNRLLQSVTNNTTISFSPQS